MGFALVDGLCQGVGQPTGTFSFHQQVPM